MKRLLTIIFSSLLPALCMAQQPDNRLYELRTYYIHPGQFDALVKQFEEKTLKLFKKHGIEQVGPFWTPASNEKKTLYYILVFPNGEERTKRWAAFDNDPERKKMVAKQKVKMVDSLNSTFMNSTDILPKINLPPNQGPIFELRTYACAPGRLPNLITRFKDHTIKIFQKHGMENVAYFTTIENNNEQPRLVYLLTHTSVEGANKSWTDFRADPDWVAAKEASEIDGKIVEKVETVFLTPVGSTK